MMRTLWKDAYLRTPPTERRLCAVARLSCNVCPCGVRSEVIWSVCVQGFEGLASSLTVSLQHGDISSTLVLTDHPNLISHTVLICCFLLILYNHIRFNVISHTILIYCCFLLILDNHTRFNVISHAVLILFSK